MLKKLLLLKTYIFDKNFMKNFFLVLAIILFSLSVSSHTTLVSPTEKTLQDNETVKIGSVQPGETFELVISRKSLNRRWANISVKENLLPSDWKLRKKTFDQTFSLFFSIPKNSAEFSQNIKVIVSDGTVSESFNASVNVKKNLINAGIAELKKQTIVNKPVSLKLNLLNESIAEHEVEINSSLPFYWFATEKLKLEPRSSVEKELAIYPRVYGLRTFNIFVDSLQNNERFSAFQVELNVLPTLKGKYLASFTGFPLFAPSLFPFYLIDAFLAWLS